MKQRALNQEVILRTRISLLARSLSSTQKALRRSVACVSWVKRSLLGRGREV